MEQRTDGALNLPEELSDEEVDEMLARMGLERAATPSYPFWRRWLCPVIGHKTVPLRQLHEADGCLREVGDRCYICEKEWRF